MVDAVATVIPRLARARTAVIHTGQVVSVANGIAVVNVNGGNADAGYHLWGKPSVGDVVSLIADGDRWLIVGTQAGDTSTDKPYFFASNGTGQALTTTPTKIALGGSSLVGASIVNGNVVVAKQGVYALIAHAGFNTKEAATVIAAAGVQVTGTPSGLDAVSRGAGTFLSTTTVVGVDTLAAGATLQMNVYGAGLGTSPQCLWARLMGFWLNA